MGELHDQSATSREPRCRCCCAALNAASGPACWGKTTGAVRNQHLCCVLKLLESRRHCRFDQDSPDADGSLPVTRRERCRPGIPDLRRLGDLGHRGIGLCRIATCAVYSDDPITRSARRRRRRCTCRWSRRPPSPTDRRDKLQQDPWNLARRPATKQPSHMVQVVHQGDHALCHDGTSTRCRALHPCL